MAACGAWRGDEVLPRRLTGAPSVAPLATVRPGDRLGLPGPRWRVDLATLPRRGHGERGFGLHTLNELGAQNAVNDTEMLT